LHKYIMQIKHLLEAIDQTSLLAQDTYSLLSKDIDRFIRANAERIFNSVGEDDYLKKMDVIDKQKQEVRDQSLDWKEEDKLLSRLSDKEQTLSGQVQSKLYDSDPDPEIIEDFIDTLELHLQDLARDYMEAQFGKVEKYNKDEPYDEIKNKNLYWLQHIIVQIDTKSKDKMTGQPKTGGGYFSKYPRRDNVHSRSSQNIDLSSEISNHINIYSSVASLWEVLIHRLLEQDSINRYGDSGFDNPIPAFIKPIISVFVHEVVHMEQFARASMKQQKTDKGFRRGDYSMIPNPDQPRPKLKSYDKSDTRGPEKQKGGYYRNYRGGRRGNETYDIENYRHNLDRWAAYLGSVNEIEAHAAHLATELYTDFMSNNPFRYAYYSADEKQSRINDFIDHAIENVKWGYMPKNSYEQIIATTAREAAKNPNPTPREKQFLKVWKLYLKKVIKHLESYKKPIPQEKL